MSNSALSGDVVARVRCRERGGVVERVVREAPRDLQSIIRLIDRIHSVPNFLWFDEWKNYHLFLDQQMIIFQVDDVGVILCKPRHEDLEVHITFWDGKLRGREQLCRTIAQSLLDEGWQNLWTAIPADRKVLIAFARRVGFTGSVVDGIFNCYFHRENRDVSWG